VKRVAISEFKAKCLSLLEQVQRTREPIRITRHGKAVAEVVPPTEEIDREAMFGSMKDSITILGDIISPADDPDDWEVLRN
jgi:prevent-host-death family protein